MRRTSLLMATAALLLSACGKRVQTMDGHRPDAPAWRGTDGTFNAPGWKAGDAAAWQEQLRRRAQRGQNEYDRLPAQR